MKRLATGVMMAFLLASPAMADEGKGTGCGMMGEMRGQKEMMGGMREGGMEMGPGPWFHHGVSLTLMNAEKLGLDEKQKAQLEEIRTKYTKEIIRQDAEHRIGEMDVETLLAADAVDLAKVKDALKKVEDVETRIRYLRIEAFTEARKVLTDEQRAKLRKLMKEKPSMKGMMGGMEMMQGGGMMGGGTMGSAAEEKGPMSQEKKAGDVTVVAAFENQGAAGTDKELAFSIKLDTHSADLDAFDFEKGVVLRDDKGKTYKPVSVKPSGSGHHRTAEVRFANPGKVSSIELVVKGVAGVRETAFQWPLKEGMMKE